ncbi:hypothetical protein ACT453_52080, partial [Bacillus sp. D-CC]
LKFPFVKEYIKVNRSTDIPFTNGNFNAASSQLPVFINSTNSLYSSFIITLPRKAVYISKTIYCVIKYIC